MGESTLSPPVDVYLVPAFYFFVVGLSRLSRLRLRVCAFGGLARSYRTSYVTVESRYSQLRFISTGTTAVRVGPVIQTPTNQAQPKNQKSIVGYSQYNSPLAHSFIENRWWYLTKT